MPLHHALLLLALLSLAAATLGADRPPGETRPGDAMAAAYFRRETSALSERCLADVRTLDDWTSRREGYRRQLWEMLGLPSALERPDLRAAVTGRMEHPEMVVENVRFQSWPGLYVTGNLYLPRGQTKPAPAILYLCGHGNVKKDGVSYDAKVFYQHHGAWLARNGYACLVIDTLELGEIEGNHHGTYRDGLWWWNARGYTPAGVEAWNGIRALDYLQSRPEVDGERLGVTGRSGGGAYSWWVAALDERVKAAAPVAGITDLENHVTDGVVEGHCDCMFPVNTYRWDFPQVAALVAPRPLLIGNTDKDPIFPLEGVVRLHEKVRKIYRLYGAADKLGLLITEGPHKDTQELQVPVLHWFNRYLKGEDPAVENAAAPLFQPEQLRVFRELPSDQQNTRIAETFVPAAAPPPVPDTAAAWARRRDGWLREVREKSFGGWPEEGAPLDTREVFAADRQGIHFSAYDFTSQAGVPLRLYLARRAGQDRADLVVLNVLGEEGWRKLLAGMRPGFAEELKGEDLPAADEKAWAEMVEMFRSFKWAMAYVAPRGIGPTAWSGNEKKRTQIRRRFMLLGQTLDGMRVWDARRAAQALRSLPAMKGVPLWMQGEREMSGVALYASLWEPEVARLDLWELPRSHRDGPDFLNVLRVLDVPQAVALAAERSKVRIYDKEQSGWEYPMEVARKLKWDPKQIQLRAVPGE
jgi:dienelactone hydrolase